MAENPVLAIIGGGASGLVGGIIAKRVLKNKGRVIILERMDRVGKKILATGNGRCNFTNVNVSFKDFYGKNPEFAKYALEKYSVKNTIDFFEDLGIYAMEEEKGKIYPYSGQASAVLDVLRNELLREKIDMITGFDVKTAEKKKNKFKIIAFSGETLYSDKVIVSAGGCASPALGSNGSGFDILKAFGHKITKLTPALVQLKTGDGDIKGLKGIKFTGNVKLFADKKLIGEENGEVLFTGWGISGPPVFQLSALCVKNKQYEAFLDFCPELSEKDIYRLLTMRKNRLSHLTMENFFVGLFNKRIGNVIAKRSGIEKLSFCVSSLNDKTIMNMTENIKDFSLMITGNNGFNNAQVTSGGVSCDEFNPKTMESVKVKGLYAAGEVMDIFGRCGGFNLQWAWSSGMLAGASAAKELLERGIVL